MLATTKTLWSYFLTSPKRNAESRVMSPLARGLKNDLKSWTPAAKSPTLLQVRRMDMTKHSVLFYTVFTNASCTHAGKSFTV